MHVPVLAYQPVSQPLLPVRWTFQIWCITASSGTHNRSQYPRLSRLLHTSLYRQLSALWYHLHGLGDGVAEGLDPGRSRIDKRWPSEAGGVLYTILDRSYMVIHHSWSTTPAQHHLTNRGLPGPYSVKAEWSHVVTPSTLRAFGVGPRSPPQ